MILMLVNSSSHCMFNLSPRLLSKSLMAFPVSAVHTPSSPINLFIHAWWLVTVVKGTWIIPSPVEVVNKTMPARLEELVSARLPRKRRGGKCSKSDGDWTPWEGIGYLDCFDGADCTLRAFPDQNWSKGLHDSNGKG